MPVLGTTIQDLLAADGWGTIHTEEISERQGEFMTWRDLPLAPATARLLQQAAPGGIYRHQFEALQASLRGENVCLTTGTASGKTLAFQATAVEILARDPGTRIAALYPLKALGRQQQERWRQATQNLGMPVLVGRIDGSVTMKERSRLLRQARIIIFTPDVLHAWLLRRLEDRDVRSFLAGLRLVIVDEAHNYSGVFGSNAAFLFRRLQHAVGHLGNGHRLQWFCASATMADSAPHIQRLCGIEPIIISSEKDTSPRQGMKVLLVSPPQTKDIHSALGNLFSAMVARTENRFISFVESRRQVESLAVIATRNSLSATDDDEVDITKEGLPSPVLPYRAGYEEGDAAQIQSWLQEGQLRGVVSTSALELGLDIGELDVGIQIGVPRSVSTLYQRLGRVGRRRPGVFMVVVGGGSYDQFILQNPSLLFNRVMPSSTVYLENRRIQYIHAMCLAGADGEADALELGEEWEPSPAEEAVWPNGFGELCRLERQGRVPADLQGLKSDGGDDPWHKFPLRDAGTGFEVECRTAGGSERSHMGSLTHAQLLREAYPGAIYYYMARPYRVDKVLLTTRKVVVSPARYYTTKPLFIPPDIYPNLGVRPITFEMHGDLVVLETELQVREAVRGWEERRGNTKEQHQYPCREWQRSSLRRTFFTTGVCLFHPVLNQGGPAGACAAEAIYEAFLLEVPTESVEVSCGSGKLRDDGLFPAGSRFLALFDQTYGSLRLTGRLLEPGKLAQCLEVACDFLQQALREATELSLEDGEETQRGTRTKGMAYEYQPAEITSALTMIRGLADAARWPPTPPQSYPNPIKESLLKTARMNEAAASLGVDGQFEEARQVILPGETGILLHGVGEEFVIEAVYFSPRDGLMYRGHRVDEDPGPVTTFFPVDRVRSVPGVTKMGLYNFDSGQVVPIFG